MTFLFQDCAILLVSHWDYLWVIVINIAARNVITNLWIILSYAVKHWLYGNPEAMICQTWRSDSLLYSSSQLSQNAVQWKKKLHENSHNLWVSSIQNSSHISGEKKRDLFGSPKGHRLRGTLGIYQGVRRFSASSQSLDSKPASWYQAFSSPKMEGLRLVVDLSNGCTLENNIGETTL